MDSFCPVVKSPLKAGFTLIELSIVLVIIGLIVGGVLVGQDLINAAGIRATISQIEKLQTAVNTFRGKYGYLPGDMPDPPATQYGFVSRPGGAGRGDGNGVIEGGTNQGFYVGLGEQPMFWTDLSASQLIGNGFSTANVTSCPSAITNAQLPQYLPPARLGQGNFIYVWSGGPNYTDQTNYFGIEAIDDILGAGFCVVQGAQSVFGLSVNQAYAMDQKMDDGLPETGRVQATYVVAIDAGYVMGDGGASDTTTAISPLPTTCYDNGGVGTSIRKYSTGVNGGTGHNCALSFRFQ